MREVSTADRRSVSLQHVPRASEGWKESFEKLADRGSTVYLAPAYPPRGVGERTPLFARIIRVHEGVWHPGTR